MRRSTVLWAVALLITLASAVYQRMTGPTHPLRGQAALGGQEIRYTLPRSQGDGDAAVRVPAPSSGTEGELAWKRVNSDDAWQSTPMHRENNELVGALPHQPPAGKLAYRVILQQANERVTLGGAPVIIRFKGEVPAAVLVVHIVCMFFGMLTSTRAGLECFRPGGNPRALILWTIALFTVGGLILGPIVQKYAFGAYWTGWPFGTDLTDNKTAVAWLAWVVVYLKARRQGSAGYWPLAAALLTLVVFGIPHSLFGSELRHS
jgi:hypothetical protein